MFPDKCFGLRMDLLDEFTEIIPSASELFIGNHLGLFANAKI